MSKQDSETVTAPKTDGRSKTSRQNGKKGGRPFDPLDVEQITKAALATVGGLPSRQILAKEAERPPVCTWLSLADRISPEAAQWLKKSVGCSPEEFRDLLGSRLEQVVAQAVSTLETRIAEMSGRDLALTFGILNDHLMKTRGFSSGSVTVHQTNVQINGMSRSDALAAITGQKQTNGDRFGSEREAGKRAPKALEITVDSDSKSLGVDSPQKQDQTERAAVPQTAGCTSENGGNVRQNP